MKNIINTFLLLAVNSLAFAQIGVNTTEPKVTLHIDPKIAKGTSGVAEGLLIPRVDRQRAQSMMQVPVSTLLYINEATTGTQTGTAKNIDEIGYYTFDGDSWMKINSDNNIYNTGGTLTDDRTVSQNANRLSFTANTNNAFSIDGTTFSVDAENNRIGVGTSTPTQTLDLEGTLRLSQTVVANRPTFLQYVSPVYVNPDNGLLTAGPRGFARASGGGRPGQNLTIAALPNTNTIARVRFVCYVDNSSNSNNGISGSYTYGDFTIIGMGPSNPVRFIDVNIRDYNGTPKPLSVNNQNTITWSNITQGNTSIRLDQSTGTLAIRNGSTVMSYFFEIIGGT